MSLTFQKQPVHFVIGDLLGEWPDQEVPDHALAAALVVDNRYIPMMGWDQKGASILVGFLRVSKRSHIVKA